MKNYIYTLAALAFMFALVSCETETAADKIAHEEIIYDKAMDYGDLPAARSALYNILALDSTNVAVKDSLFRFYYRTGQPVQTVLVGREIEQQEDRSKDTTFIQKMAESEESARLNKEALSSYEELYAMTNDVKHLYQIAGLQFKLGRSGECSNTLQKIINDPNAQDAKVVFTYEQLGSQEVPVSAAAFNIAGMLAWRDKDVENSQKYFQQALEIAPKFRQAYVNLENLKQQLQQQDVNGGATGG